MGTDGAGGIAESCLPQHRQVEQAFDQDDVAELEDRFPCEQTAFGTGQQAMGEGTANAAAVQVDDVILLAAGEDHAPAKRICALRINQACFKHPFQRVAEALQVSAQIAAASLANPEFCDELGIMHAAPGQVIHAFAMAV